MKRPRIPKPPDWLLTAIQWTTITILTGFAVLNSITDHGIAMAINCFFLGFMFFSMLMRAWLDRRFAEMDKLFGELKAAEAQAIGTAEAMQQAINEGRIEVFPVGGDWTEIKPPTRH